jgi:hypothetical protein
MRTYVTDDRGDLIAARADLIARRAYQRFQKRGGEHGHDLDDWLEAERAVANAT